MNTNTTRRGKIARLPQDIRTEVNQRLDNAQPAEIILRWLNQLGRVRKILAEQFAGAPVSPQNLSQWRTGGFRDWQGQQDKLALAEQFSRGRGRLEPRKSRRPLTDCLATVLTLELAKALEALDDSGLRGRERWKQLKPLFQQLARLRRGDHHAARLRLDREQHEAREARRKRLLQDRGSATEGRPKIGAITVNQTTVEPEEADAAQKIVLPAVAVNSNGSDATSSATAGTAGLRQNDPEKSKPNKPNQS